MHLGAIRDEIQDEAPGLGRIGGPQDGDSVRLEGGRSPFDADVVRDRPVPMDERPVDAGLEFADHWMLPARGPCR